MACDNFVCHLKKGLKVLIIVVLLVQILEGYSWFRNLDHAFLDLFAYFRRQKAIEIYIVEITDEDYRQLFGGKSPLHPAQVLELLKALAQARPGVIGVDLDTHDEEWNKATLWKEYGDVLSARNIVWAGVPINPSAIDQARGPLPEMACPLGGKLVSLDQIGIALLPEDPDGKVRRHRREFSNFVLHCGSPTTRHLLEPFDMAVLRKCEDLPACAEILRGKPSPIAKPYQPFLIRAARYLGTSEPEEFYIDFSPNRYSFRIVQASEFLDATRTAGVYKAAAKPEHEQRLAGRVVLLGGSFAEGRDVYWTSVGKRPGIELFASGIQAAVNEPVLPAEWWPVRIVSIGIDLGFGFLVITVYYLLFRKHPKLAYGLGLVSIVVPPFLSQWFYFSFNMWVGTVPVMAGVFIHQVYESFKSLEKSPSMEGVSPVSPPGQVVPAAPSSGPPGPSTPLAGASQPPTPPPPHSSSKPGSA